MYTLTYVLNGLGQSETPEVRACPKESLSNNLVKRSRQLLLVCPYIPVLLHAPQLRLRHALRPPTLPRFQAV